MQGPPLTFTYRIYHIESGSLNFPFLVGKYAALFLRALSTNPESFGVAYSTEASLTPAEVAIRLARPNVDVFVCVAHHSSLPDHDHSIERGEWIGMVTQVGPTPKKVYWLAGSGAPEPLDDNVETKWHHTALWIDPAHRGKGLAMRILEAAVTFAGATSASGVEQIRVRMFTGPTNGASKILYGRSGFEVVGKCTIAEAMIGNGNSTYPFLGRTDWTDEFLNAREGLLMEKIVKLNRAA